MREKLARFMYGRYGNDQLNQFLTYFCLALIVINIFVKNSLLNLLVVLLIVLVYFRMFSKNIQKRYEENMKFTARTAKFSYRFDQFKKEFAQRKTHRFFRCPSCKQKVRVPKGKGNIMITCPKCRTEFQKHT